jgi:hypothetical protein
MNSCVRSILRMMRVAKLGVTLGAALLGLGVIGLLVASAWYHDDACTIEPYQCRFGTIGFSVAFILLPLGTLVLAVSMGAAGVAHLRRR